MAPRSVGKELPVLRLTGEIDRHGLGHSEPGSDAHLGDNSVVALLAFVHRIGQGLNDPPQHPFPAEYYHLVETLSLVLQLGLLSSYVGEQCGQEQAFCRIRPCSLTRSEHCYSTVTSFCWRSAAYHQGYATLLISSQPNYINTFA